MFVIILTLTTDFLATIRALAAELPNVYIDTHPVQELEFQPDVTEAEALHWVETYINSGRYDNVKLIHRQKLSFLPFYYQMYYI